MVLPLVARVGGTLAMKAAKAAMARKAKQAAKAKVRRKLKSAAKGTASIAATGGAIGVGSGKLSKAQAKKRARRQTKKK